jgi:signal transduction histidine kinase
MMTVFLIPVDEPGEELMADQNIPPHDLEELKLTLQRSPIMRALMEIAPDAMQEALRDEHVRAGTVLFREGDPADRVYAIWSGRLRIQHEVGAGEVLVMRECVPGEVVGELSLLDQRPRSATVVVAEDARLVSLSRDDFSHLITSKPEVTLALLQALSHRLRSSDDYLIAASRSVDYLTQRLGDRADHPEDAAQILTPGAQWEGLGTLFRDIVDASHGILDGLEVLSQSGHLAHSDHDVVSLVRGQARLIAGKVDQLLSLQELQSGAVALNIQPVMIGALADKVAARLTPTARTLGILIDVIVQIPIPMMRVDEGLMEYLFTQLIQNALRYAPRGSAIRVEIGHFFGRELHISVADTGPGVPEELHEAIFEPFVKVPGDESSGLGLGLSYCRAIVRAHGGRIWLENNPGGQGAMFKIILPTPH